MGYGLFLLRVDLVTGYGLFLLWVAGLPAVGMVIFVAGYELYWLRVSFDNR
jgi:hypothetical protein